mmetsp:Transcript_8218/g.10100  ORF Transcript_8218/g.10100 Transcript_8218/m.10100 type:complete len:202 (-) Transcript_8218:166-771(-)
MFSTTGPLGKKWIILIHKPKRTIIHCSPRNQTIIPIKIALRKPNSNPTSHHLRNPLRAPLQHRHDTTLQILTLPKRLVRHVIKLPIRRMPQNLLQLLILHPLKPPLQRRLLRPPRKQIHVPDARKTPRHAGGNRQRFLNHHIRVTFLIFERGDNLTPFLQGVHCQTWVVQGGKGRRSTAGRPVDERFAIPRTLRRTAVAHD